MTGMYTFLILIIFILIAPPLTMAAVTVSGQVGQAAPDSLTLVWTFELAPGWHLYGPHRNDTGLPPQVELDLPDGWHAGPIGDWPLPRRHVVADLILDHIYEDRLALSQTIHHPAEARPASIQARVSWLVCNEICVPGDTTLTVQLPRSASPEGATALAQVHRFSPQPLPDGLVDWNWSGSRLNIAVPGARDLLFIPMADGPTISNLLVGGQAQSSSLTLWVDNVTDNHKNISGYLLFFHNNTEISGSITFTLPQTTGGTP